MTKRARKYFLRGAMHVHSKEYLKQLPTAWAMGCLTDFKPIYRTIKQSNETPNKVLIELALIGHEKYPQAIIFGIVVMYLIAERQELNTRKKGKTYIN